MPSKYLYLAKPEYAEKWVSGGRIPLSSPNAYLRTERNGVLTPSEGVAQVGVNLSAEDAEELRRIIQGPAEIHIGTLLGGPVPRRNVHLHYTPWDGLLLCMSNAESRGLCFRLNKRVCVEVERPQAVWEHIRKQLGASGQARACEYTAGPNLDVFTKAEADSWQDEYRMYWEPPTNVVAPVEVEIPPGSGKIIWALDEMTPKKLGLVLAQWASVNPDGTFTVVRGGITEWTVAPLPLEVSLSALITICCDELEPGTHEMHLAANGNYLWGSVTLGQRVNLLRLALPVSIVSREYGDVSVRVMIGPLSTSIALSVKAPKSPE